MYYKINFTARENRLFRWKRRLVRFCFLAGLAFLGLLAWREYTFYQEPEQRFIAEFAVSAAPLEQRHDGLTLYVDTLKQFAPLTKFIHGQTAFSALPKILSSLADLNAKLTLVELALSANGKWRAKTRLRIPPEAENMKTFDHVENEITALLATNITVTPLWPVAENQETGWKELDVEITGSLQPLQMPALEIPVAMVAARNLIETNRTELSKRTIPEENQKTYIGELRALHADALARAKNKPGISNLCDNIIEKGLDDPGGCMIKAVQILKDAGQDDLAARAMDLSRKWDRESGRRFRWNNARGEAMKEKAVQLKTFYDSVKDTVKPEWNAALRHNMTNMLNESDTWYGKTSHRIEQRPYHLLAELVKKTGLDDRVKLAVSDPAGPNEKALFILVMWKVETEKNPAFASQPWMDLLNEIEKAPGLFFVTDVNIEFDGNRNIVSAAMTGVFPVFDEKELNELTRKWSR